MASHSQDQAMALAREKEGESYLRVARGPVKAGHAIALPVLAEAGHVIEVVGTEVQDGGPCMVGGKGGEDKRRRRQHEEHRKVRGGPADRAAIRRRRARRPGYVVTSTAA